MSSQQVIDAVRNGTLSVVEDNPHYRIFDCTVKETPALRLLCRTSGDPISLGEPMLEYMNTPPLHEFISDHDIPGRDDSPEEVYVYNWVEKAQGPMIFDVGVPVPDGFTPPDNDAGYIVKDYLALRVASVVYEGPFPYQDDSGWGNIEWERRAKEKGFVYTEKVYRELYHDYDWGDNRHITEIQLSIE